MTGTDLLIVLGLLAVPLVGFCLLTWLMCAYNDSRVDKYSLPTSKIARPRRRP
jgi:hypothetical protein